MGTFSRYFNTNLAPQYRAFSRALKIEGEGNTNDWCITNTLKTICKLYVKKYTDQIESDSLILTNAKIHKCLF